MYSRALGEIYRLVCSDFDCSCVLGAAVIEVLAYGSQELNEL